MPRTSGLSLSAGAAAALLLPLVQAATYSHYAAVPAGWTAAGSPAADTVQTFTLALTMQNIDQLETQLLDVSTPGSANYGSHWDQATVSSYFAPSSDAVSDVTSWLESNGVTAYKVDGAFVDFAATLDVANTLLNASYESYTKAGTTKLRTLSYSLPDSVDEHIVLVDPGLYIGSSRAYTPIASAAKTRSEPRAVVDNKRGLVSRAATIDAACRVGLSPACLKELYNVGNYSASATSGSSVGFGSFLNESAIYSDLFEYEKLFGIPTQNFSVVLIANATNDQDIATAEDGEANLDVQNIVGIAHPLPVVEYITGGSPPFVPNIDQPTAADNENEPYVTYYRYLLSQPSGSLPPVISNSYGDEEDSVPYDYAVLTCNLIGQLGLRGITVFESSGDLGVGAGCLAPDNNTVEFNAIFPATCPYLTSVGGTINLTPEIAWDGSSGGFSNYFAQPSWQTAAVDAYIKDHVSNSTLAYYGQYTNFSGRGFPDVAAHSVTPDYEIVYGGILEGSGGTSAAAPLWAGIVGLLNDARLRAGKSTLGWLNPLIYAHGAEVLTDITAGYSIGCLGYNTQTGGTEPEGAGQVPGARWNATTGWDPVTGYGTPDFQKLKSLVLGY
ncbi:peptidase S8/S53 domain-containing protein [Coniella lustricola]|uniref:tripeptidyl-peptidase II n=1 Tax=Coniella lustricola TaxID=2025994 RepID=A0A2T2ZYW0_9PEZI|nr:peptidase S8/S53 domain-containing protein [Coniella lustricola]